MPPLDTYRRDRAHGQPIPLGKPLANLIRGIMPRLLVDARKQVRQGRRVDLSAWLAPLRSAAVPLVLRYFLDGYQFRATAILQRVLRVRRKSLNPIQSIGTSFTLFRPEVSAYVDSATLAFCQSTLDTVASHVGDAVEAVRAELGEALEQGSTTREINARMAAIFDDPHRAARIGQTEASRAMHAGQLAAATQSGVSSGLEWLASSDACPLCLVLNGKKVALGEPFAIEPKAGPYSLILHPPRHPHCACTTTDVIEPSDAAAADLDQLRSMAAMGRVGAGAASEGTMTLSLYTLGRKP